MAIIIPAQNDYATPLCDLLKKSGFFSITPTDKTGGTLDKIVMSAVMKLICDKIPNPPQTQGEEIRPDILTLDDHRSTESKRVIDELRKTYEHMVNNDISSTFFGETHGNANDRERVGSYMTALQDNTLPQPTLTIFERGLDYPTVNLVNHFVREENLTTSNNAPLGAGNGAHNWGFALSSDQRSMITAGYITLSIAADPNQENQERIMLFFGQNHSSLVTKYLEYYYRHITPWILTRKRIDLIVNSTTQA
ncbi:hypothetical protein [Chromobacterium piscinae]|uniref:hypothetical protein n=1 Tax=Chromobacterium piscinae TaxID=686831 RepID=UPI003F802E95